ncbi:phage portal protein [Paenibacillus thailandensis]|uniref:Phage portal protein n=1 Tax=Paenibacillus thailandensis TaxID=393250 RepID=A0ABW5R2J1_9BACL
MGLINKWRQWRDYEKRAQTLEELLLEVGVGVEAITKQQALSIPAVASNVNLISGVIAMLPVYLYKEEGGKKISVIKDDRVKLLNDDTKDTLDAFQLKRQLIEDYLLSGAGYFYINKERNRVKSLNYVDTDVLSANKNSDPIFKDYDILVNGRIYRPFDFIKLTRKTKDGVNGVGIVQESNKALTVAYLTLQFEQILLKTGGNKKGFLKAKGKLTEEALTALKNAWNRLYRDNSENVMVLNEGTEFQETSATSVEMQMNENKRTNSSEINNIFGIPNGTLDDNAIKTTILPILKAFETALNKDLLLESEKDQYYWEFDKEELVKGDILKRYQAYEIGLKNGWIQWDDIRYKENLEPYGLDFIKLGLQDVLFNPKTKEIYTPNTNKTASMGGGDRIESGDSQ